MRLIKKDEYVEVDFSETELDNYFISDCLEYFGSKSTNRYYKYESDNSINNITKIYRFKLMTMNNNIDITLKDDLNLIINNNEDLMIHKTKRFKISEFPSLMIFFENQCPYLYNFYKNDDNEYEISAIQKHNKYYSQTKTKEHVNLFNLTQNCFENNQTMQIIVLVYLMAKFYNEATNFKINIESRSDNFAATRFDPNMLLRNTDSLIQCLLSTTDFDQVITDKIPFLIDTDSVTNLEIIKSMNNNILKSSHISLKYKDKRDLLLLSFINSLNNFSNQ
jgi:hypothetical protein